MITQLCHCCLIYLIIDEASLGRNRRYDRAITYVKVLVIDGELLSYVTPGLPVDRAFGEADLIQIDNLQLHIVRLLYSF